MATTQVSLPLNQYTSLGHGPMYISPDDKIMWAAGAGQPSPSDIGRERRCECGFAGARAAVKHKAREFPRRDRSSRHPCYYWSVLLFSFITSPNVEESAAVAADSSRIIPCRPRPSLRSRADPSFAPQPASQQPVWSLHVPDRLPCGLLLLWSLEEWMFNGISDRATATARAKVRYPSKSTSTSSGRSSMA